MMPKMNINNDLMMWSGRQGRVGFLFQNLEVAIEQEVVGCKLRK